MKSSNSDDFARFVALLPEPLRSVLKQRDDLVEVHLDLGRKPRLLRLEGPIEILDVPETKSSDLSFVLSKLSEFNDKNRAGLDGTLHRFSIIKGENDQAVGLTCRVGRSEIRSIDLIEDLIAKSIIDLGQSLLIVGPPGSGKTTLLRQIASNLASDLTLNVLIVDRSSEIAGSGSVPHPVIGNARRMQVPIGKTQFDIMLEAVENHFPDVVIVDEIGTSQEALAARTISQRGVSLIATCHGSSLESLINNPVMLGLIGGLESATISDAEMRRRKSGKTIQERRSSPTFQSMVELVDFNEIVIHRNVASSVDAILSGRAPVSERRTRQR